MKTAAKTGLAFLASLAGLAVCIQSTAFAQVSGGAVSAVASSAQQVASATTAPLSSGDGAKTVPLPGGGAAMPSVAPPQTQAVPPSTPSFDKEPDNVGKLALGGKGPLDKDNDKNGGKIPDSVKSVVKKLNGAGDNVTVEDLNAAREAVAKLDILIEIEKRMNDLATLRQEREEKLGGGLANAIPASALGRGGVSLPVSPQIQSPVAIQPVNSAPMAAPVNFVPSESIEIQKIAGAGGRYMAYVKAGDGKVKMYREGDKLPDGSVVVSISGHGMTVKKDKKTRTIQVKDVAVVFNGR
jgi:hypothetical protein